MSGLQRVVQSGCGFRFHADDFYAICIPGSDAADESAPAYGNEQRIEIVSLLLKLKPDRALTEQRLDLIVGVHRERARLGGPLLAGGQRFRIAFASHDKFRAVAANTLDFFGRCDGWYKNLCRN